MGTRLIAKGVTFANYIDITRYPVSADHVALHYINTDITTSRVNHVSGYPGLNTSTSWGGNVTYDSVSGLFTGNMSDPANHLASVEVDNASDDYTLLAVVKHLTALGDSSTIRQVWGVYSGATNCASLMSNTATLANGTLYQASYNAPVPPHSDYQFLAMTVNDAGSGLMQAYSARGNSLVVGGSVAQKRTKNASALRIGGNGGSFTGQTRIAAVSKHRRVLTASEVQDIYRYWRSRFAALGMTIA